MGIAMGTHSYADYLASKGIETFLVDMRGYGLSTPIDEQLNVKVEKPTSMLSFEDDIHASCKWIRAQFDYDIILTAVGFSMQAMSLLIFNNKYPKVLDKIVSLSPPSPWGKMTKMAFASEMDESLCFEVKMKSMVERLEKAQLPGKDFRESSWYDEAVTALSTHHKTYNKRRKSWMIAKLPDESEYIKSNVINTMKPTSCKFLLIASKYDTEFPEDSVRDLYNHLNPISKEFKVIPNATHLVIWEKNRKVLYKWTAEFAKD
jgi:pimeloyl-ACP methyl ester carboxylesterase